MISAWAVLGFATVTAIATGLGALPFFFFRRITRHWLGISNAIAGGVMIAASGGLVLEGFTVSVGRVALGAAIGLVFIVLSHRWLQDLGEVQVGRLRGADAVKALMIVGVMTVHSFTEGVGVGVAFGGGQALGTSITTAIAIHNIPEGLAISLVLVPRGTSAWAAAGWSIFSSLPQPLVAVPAYLFVERFAPFLPIGLGFAAGAMLWMVASELVPDALETAGRVQVVVALVVSILAMSAFQLFIQHP